MRYPVSIGCTSFRHRQIGVNAVVNARAGRQDLNEISLEDTELMRDARKIRDWVERRVVCRQFNSRFMRRNRHRVRHILWDNDDS